MDRYRIARPFMRQVKLFGEGVKDDMACRHLICQYSVIHNKPLRRHMTATPSFHLPSTGNLSLQKIRHADGLARAQRYNSLTAKMSAYQQGTGPAPTLAEFTQWKEDAAFERAIGRLLAKALLPR